MYAYILMLATLSACSFGRDNYRHLTCYNNGEVILDIAQPSELRYRGSFLRVTDPVLNVEIITNVPCIYTKGQ